MPDSRLVPPDDAPIVQVADAIRHAHARQRDPQLVVTDWEHLVVPARLMWLELAYAAISAWAMVRPPSD